MIRQSHDLPHGSRRGLHSAAPSGADSRHALPPSDNVQSMDASIYRLKYRDILTLCVIALLCRRFTQQPYTQFFPSDWYEESPRELISKKPASEICVSQVGLRSTVWRTAKCCAMVSSSGFGSNRQLGTLAARWARHSLPTTSIKPVHAGLRTNSMA